MIVNAIKCPTKKKNDFCSELPSLLGLATERSCHNERRPWLLSPGGATKHVGNMGNHQVPSGKITMFNGKNHNFNGNNHNF